MTQYRRDVGFTDDRAREWLEESLRGGHELAAAVLGAVRFDAGRFQLALPESEAARAVTGFDQGGVVGASLADAALAQYLDDFASRGALCVLVEDDLLRQSDPAVARRPVPSAFIGDHVIHWCELARGAGSIATEVIRMSASGYPLNAFLVTKSAADLRLSPGGSLVKDFTTDVVASLAAVVVSAFDGESFLMWDTIG
jgi:hypothetical protein